MSKLNATLQKALDDYSAFLDAGASYAESMRNAAKALGETPCPTFIESLAKIHAAKYKCNYNRINNHNNHKYKCKPSHRHKGKGNRNAFHSHNNNNNHNQYKCNSFHHNNPK